MQLFQRYLWLISLLRTHSRLTLGEIQAHFMRSSLYEGQPLSTRTFFRHRDAAASLFGVQIVYRKPYYTLDEQPLSAQIDTFFARQALNAFSVRATLSDDASLRARISTESEALMSDYLIPFLSAMQRSVMVSFLYSPYTTQPMRVHVAPYGLKAFRRRWYVIAPTPADDATVLAPDAPESGYRVYAFDRISELSLVDTPFTLPSDFSLEGLFRHNFGIFLTPHLAPDEVTLRAADPVRQYLRSTPLHPSQREVLTSAQFSEFRLTVVPTPDLVFELLSYADGLEVLAPASLRATLRTRVGRLSAMYAE